MGTTVAADKRRGVVSRQEEQKREALEVDGRSSTGGCRRISKRGIIHSTTGECRTVTREKVRQGDHVY